jgi:hypothetical protein
MQTQQTITLFGTVSNTATSRTSKTGRKYTAFGVSMIYDRNRQEFSYNVVAWGKQGHFAKSLQKGTRIKLVVQAQSQPDNIASIPLLTATFVGGRGSGAPDMGFQPSRVKIGVSGVSSLQYRASMACLNPTHTDNWVPSLKRTRNSRPKASSSRMDNSTTDFPTTSGNSILAFSIVALILSVHGLSVSLIRGLVKISTNFRVWHDKPNRTAGDPERAAMTSCRATMAASCPD